MNVRELQVLVVDDEPGVRSYVGAVLRRNGCRVFEAEHGKAGYEALHRVGGDIDLLITDIVMPIMNGADLAVMVRAEYPNVPVLFVSGYPADDRPKLPGTGFLAKPFAPHALIQASWALVAPDGC